MATDVDQTFYGWSKDEFSDRDDSQEASVSQMLDHGSISFGRFAAESLSWERRSVFAHDRRQEELEKVNGLVAKKKAYFEEYYKRLRALKALQQNQQTELTLDYGGDGSNSSQTGEGDETVLQVGTLQDGAAETIDASSGEPTNELTFMQDMNCGEDLQTRQSYPGSTTSDIDSLRKNIEKIELEKYNSIHAVQMQDLETESLLSITRSTEEIEQNDIGGVDDKEILGEQESLVSNVEPGPTSDGSVSDLTNSRASESQLAPDYNLIPDKTKLAVEKSPEGKLFPEVKKEPAASVRTGLESTHGTRREAVRSSRGAKHPGQKLIGKADSNAHSGKAIASKVTSNHGSASVSSHRSVAEVCSSITSARPFSRSMERRSGTGIRESAVRSDSKTSNRLASSQNRENGRSSVQGGSKKTITSCSVKSHGLQNKRDCKEVIRKSLPSESQETSLKGKDAHVLRQSKLSSNNLPVRNKSNSNGGSEVQFTNTIQRNKRKEEKEDVRLKEPRGPKKMVTPVTVNPWAGNKKAFPSGIGVPSNGGRKSQVNSMSLDGRKLKHGTLPWR
ncbi:protein WVD2-like 7 [Cocos nucifera]|uniref:Protein WVD2-like 7 n=1 Tax=Cocos nucifera TaxID=13894 RepID=A0A8K0MW14_COCNU|nr:protein WVD2-like 7 [Cocos nucifera]